MNRKPATIDAFHADEYAFRTPEAWNYDGIIVSIAQDAIDPEGNRIEDGTWHVLVDGGCEGQAMTREEALERGEEVAEAFIEDMEAESITTEDGYRFYVRPCGRVVDHLDPDLVDISWPSVEAAYTDGNFKRKERYDRKA